MLSTPSVKGPTEELMVQPENHASQPDVVDAMMDEHVAPDRLAGLKLHGLTFA